MFRCVDIGMSQLHQHMDNVDVMWSVGNPVGMQRCQIGTCGDVGDLLTNTVTHGLRLIPLSYNGQVFIRRGVQLAQSSDIGMVFPW